MKKASEWSIEFDLAYNNLASNKAPGVGEYEKSVYLTHAQESVVLGLCNGSLGASFEATEPVTVYLAPLVAQGTPVELTDEEKTGLPILGGSESHVFKLEDCLFRTYEHCKLTYGNCTDQDAVVVPVTQDEYWRTKRNPFKGPSGNKVLRLSFGEAVAGSGGKNVLKQTDIYSELIAPAGATLSEYTVQYIKRPEPIILENLTGGLSINNKTTVQTCMLDEALHQTILSEAVRMAKAAWSA